MKSSSNSQGLSYGPSLIPFFDGESYDIWSLQMKTLFVSQELWELVEDGFEQPESSAVLSTWSQAKQKEYKENKKKDAKALLNIQQGISKSIFPRIMGAKNAKEAWEILKVEFQGSDKVISIKLQSLWRDFDTLMMKESEYVQVFFTRFLQLLSRFEVMEILLKIRKLLKKF